VLVVKEMMRLKRSGWEKRAGNGISAGGDVGEDSTVASSFVFAYFMVR
jgi:hypothetical protein